MKLRTLLFTLLFAFTVSACDSAEKASEQVAAKAKEVATETAGKVKDAATETAAKAKEVATEAAGNVKDAATETVTNAVAATDKLKVGFVYVGPVGDHGWTYQHDQGRLDMEKALGVETTFVENVAEGADAERVIRKLASSGSDIIFTTSFGFMNPTLKVAKDFPNVKFEHATGYKRADNVSTYSARFYEGRAIPRYHRRLK